MPSIAQAVYTATATSSGGRAGTTASSDGRLNLQLSTPKGLGGDDGPVERIGSQGPHGEFEGGGIDRRNRLPFGHEISDVDRSRDQAPKHAETEIRLKPGLDSSNRDRAAG